MKIGVTGIGGRMGLAIANLVAADDIAQLGGALTRENSNHAGKDLGAFLGLEENGIKITTNIEEFVQSCEAIIDFSSPALSLKVAKICAENKKPIICGTTGFTDVEKQEFASYAKENVMVWSSNMSLGVNLLMNLVENVSSILHDDFDIEIVEMHHKNKVDAPSGTALSLGAAAAAGRNVDLKEVGNLARSGREAKRNRGEIGFCALRGGDVIGDHNVIFAGDGERLELGHKASNRDVFAKGAIRAAIWSSVQQPGFYSMRDVLK